MRAKVGRTILSEIVVSQLDSLLTARRSFTAFAVTTALRKEYPELQIDHRRIRPIVHKLMRGAIKSGQYEACLWCFGENSAVLYMPGSPVFVAESRLLLFSPN